MFPLGIDQASKKENGFWSCAWLKSLCCSYSSKNSVLQSFGWLHAYRSKLLFVTSAQLLRYPRVISSSSRDLQALYAELSILCSAHLKEIYFFTARSLFSLGCHVQYSQESVAVHNIRLKVGINDILSKVSPNYPAKPLSDCHVEGCPSVWTVKVCGLHFKQNYLKNIA